MAGNNNQADDTLPSIGDGVVRTIGPHTQTFGGAQQKVLGLGLRRGGGVFKGWGGGPLPLKPLKRLNTPRGLTVAKGSPVGITQSGQDCGHTNRECHLVYCILSFSKAAFNFGLFCHVCKTNMLFVVLLEGRQLFILPLLRP